MEKCADPVDVVGANAEPMRALGDGVVAQLAGKAGEWRKAREALSLDLRVLAQPRQDHAVHVGHAASWGEDAIAFGQAGVSHVAQGQVYHFALE